MSEEIKKALTALWNEVVDMNELVFDEKQSERSFDRFRARYNRLYGLIESEVKNDQQANI